VLLIATTIWQREKLALTGVQSGCPRDQRDAGYDPGQLVQAVDYGLPTRRSFYTDA
jgi:hypothetical protein